MPSSMLTSIMLAPPRTWSSATSAASAYFASRIRRAKRARPGDVGALADHLEVAVRADGQRLEAREPREALRLGDPARRAGPRRPRATARMWSGVVPQQPPTMFTKPSSTNVLDEPAGLGRRLVVLAEGVRQAGVRVGAHPARREARELRHVGPHLARAERAVDPDAERPRVRDRHPEGVHRLARQRPAAAVRDRHREHHRQLDALLVEHLLDGHDGRLGVQRVEDRLDEQHVHAAVHEPAHLLAVGVAQRVERDRAVRRVVHVRRDRQRPVRRARWRPPRTAAARASSPSTRPPPASPGRADATFSS